jgi:hypothetical protein
MRTLIAVCQPPTVPDQPLPTDLDRSASHWQQVFQLAVQNGLLPSLYHSLYPHISHANPQAPLPMASCMAQSLPLVMQLTSYNFRMLQELLRVIEAFRVANIDVIPFKGPIHAFALHGGMSHRSFRDLDLLVAPEQMLQAKDLLESLGYRSQMNIRWESHFVLAQSVPPITVDLHERFAPHFFAFAFGLKDLQPRLQPLLVGNTTLKVPSPEDMLLILCANLGRDCCHWNLRLVQLQDVQALLARYPVLDWTYLVQQATQLGCLRLLLLQFELVNRFFPIAYPTALKALTRKHQDISALATTIENRLRQGYQRRPPEEMSFWAFMMDYDHWLYLRLRERWGDRLRYLILQLQNCLRVALFPRPETQLNHGLPWYLAFLAVPFHWIRLVKKRILRPLWQLFSS